MKKLLFLAALALVFTSCQKTDYKALGEQYAKRLIELCEKNDTAAVLAHKDTGEMMHLMQNSAFFDPSMIDQGLYCGVRVGGELICTAGVSAMRKALFDAHIICAPFITEAKMEAGKTKDEAVQDVIDDALKGNGNVTAVTNAIRAANEREKKEGKASDDNKPVRSKRVP